MPVSPLSALIKTAHELRARGIALCGTTGAEKRPVYPGWTRFSLEPSHFGALTPLASDNNGQLAPLASGFYSGMGILAGSLSGDLVIVDLDRADIRAEAIKRLPSTTTDGRPSTGPAHWYYRVHNIPPWAMADQNVAGGIGGPRIFHFTDADGKPIGIDFLGTGAQVVCPPSLHHSGERRRWFDEPDRLVTLPYLDLWAVVKQLAKDFGAVDKRDHTRQVLETGRGLGPILQATRRRAVAYLKHCDAAIAGQQGHARTMWAARVVVWGFDLGAGAGFDVLQEHYNPRCMPEWSDAELHHKCLDADTTPFDRPRGWLRDRL